MKLLTKVIVSFLLFLGAALYVAPAFAGEGAPMPTCYPGKNCGD